MRILYFAPQPCWPLTTGARLRNYHLAGQLGRRCAVTYVGLSKPGEPQYAPLGARFEANIVLTRQRSYTLPKLVRGMLGPVPLTVLNYYSARVAADLAEILEAGSFDAVQLESVHLMEYLPVIRAASSRPAVLADWHNIESELIWRYAATAPGLPRRLAARRTASLIERAERRMLAACDAHTVASERERGILAGRQTGAVLHVIPNGVDVEHYSPFELNRLSQQTHANGEQILFVGSMDYQANIDAVLWFVKEIWPDLRQAGPQLSFTVVGRNPAPEVKMLAAEGVTISGTVKDVRPFYANALLLVVPIRFGSGTRLKILEAMAAGVPVVSTRAGAEGLAVEHGEHLLLADTAAEIGAAVQVLARSPDLRRQLIAAGRKLVAEKYDWNILGDQLYGAHCGVLQRQQRLTGRQRQMGTSRSANALR